MWWPWNSAPPRSHTPTPRFTRAVSHASPKRALSCLERYCMLPRPAGTLSYPPTATSRAVRIHAPVTQWSYGRIWRWSEGICVEEEVSRPWWVWSLLMKRGQLLASGLQPTTDPPGPGEVILTWVYVTYDVYDIYHVYHWWWYILCISYRWCTSCILYIKYHDIMYMPM
jgi:hypothetical protein